jgi:hypothetical protein
MNRRSIKGTAVGYSDYHQPDDIRPIEDVAAQQVVIDMEELEYESFIREMWLKLQDLCTLHGFVLFDKINVVDWLKFVRKSSSKYASSK